MNMSGESVMSRTMVGEGGVWSLDVSGFRGVFIKFLYK